MLNLAVGSPVPFGDGEGIATRIGVTGHALFGPYEEREAGRYAVAFTIAAGEEGEAAKDGICAIVDVVADKGKTDVAFDYVLRSQLSADTPITLEFDLLNPSVLEYRVWTNGQAPLLIADHPVVTPRPQERPA